MSNRKIISASIINGNDNKELIIKLFDDVYIKPYYNKHLN